MVRHFFIVVLLLAGTLHAQIAPPTKVVKKRHGQLADLTWTYSPDPVYVLQYFSVKAAYDLNQTPTEIEQVPPTARQKALAVTFTPQYPKFVYYIVTPIQMGPDGRVESKNSNTVGAERIGPPPSSW